LPRQGSCPRAGGLQRRHQPPHRVCKPLPDDCRQRQILTATIDPGQQQSGIYRGGFPAARTTSCPSRRVVLLVSSRAAGLIARAELFETILPATACGPIAAAPVSPFCHRKCSQTTPLLCPAFDFRAGPQHQLQLRLALGSEFREEASRHRPNQVRRKENKACGSCRSRSPLQRRKIRHLFVVERDDLADAISTSPEVRFHRRVPRTCRSSRAPGRVLSTDSPNSLFRTRNCTR